MTETTETPREAWLRAWAQSAKVDGPIDIQPHFSKRGALDVAHSDGIPYSVGVTVPLELGNDKIDLYFDVDAPEKVANTYAEAILLRLREIGFKEITPHIENPTQS